jgi:hypothetical protein
LGLLGLGFGIFKLVLERVALAGQELRIPFCLLGLGFGIFELRFECIARADLSSRHGRGALL